jgi:hypothetical protein
MDVPVVPVARGGNSTWRYLWRGRTNSFNSIASLLPVKMAVGSSAYKFSQFLHLGLHFYLSFSGKHQTKIIRMERADKGLSIPP